MASGVCWASRRCIPHPQAQQNKDDWELHLVAYLSLCQEQVGRISLGGVSDRINVLHFVARLLGIPLFPAWPVVVHAMRSGSAGVPLPANIDPSTMTTIVTAAGPCLGLWMRTDLLRSSDTLFQRPSTSTSLPVLQSRRTLATSLPDDQSFMDEMFGRGSADGSSGAFEVTPATVHVKAEEQARNEFSRLDAKLSTLEVGVKELLKRFGFGCDWEAVRESRFTPFLSKLAALHVEACGMGDQQTIAASTKLMKGLTAGKHVMRCHREIGRAKDQTGKLLDYAQSYLDFVPFLHSEGVQVPQALLLYYLKVVFLTTLAEHGCFANSLQSIMQKGFDRVCAASTASDASSSAQPSSRLCEVAWLRSLIFQAILRMVREASTDNFQDFIDGFCQNLKSCHDLLSSHGSLKIRFKALSDDIHHLEALFAASLEPCSIRPSAVLAASKTLVLPHMAELKEALFSTDVGKEVTARYTTLLQMSAKDTVADSKLGRAQEILADSRLPRVRHVPGAHDGETTEQIDLGLLHDMSAVDLLGEGLTLVTESISLWTTGRLQEQADSVCVWLDALCTQTLFIDAALSLHLGALVQRAGDEWLNPTPPEDSMPNDFVSCLAEVPAEDLERTLNENMVPDRALVKFATKVRAFVDSLQSEYVRASARNWTSVSKVDEYIQSNSEVRAGIVNVLLCISAIRDVGITPKTAMAEWIAKKGQGKEEDSLFGRLTILESHRQNLKGMTYLNATDNFGKEIMLVCEESDRFSDLVADSSFAFALPDTVEQARVHSFATAFLRTSLQALCDEFATSLPLEGIRFPVLPSTRNLADLPALCEAFFVKSLMVELVKVASKVFACTSGRKSKTWESTEIRNLIGQVAASLPSNALEVNMGAFCSVVQGEPCPSISGMSDLVAAFELLDSMAQVAISIAVVHAKFLAEHEALRDHRLKTEVVQAVSSMKHTVNLMRSRFDQNHWGEIARFAPIRWHAPVGQARRWFDEAHEFLPLLCKQLLVFSACACSRLSVEVAALTPKYDHCVNDDVFVENVARRQLLNWPSRDSLGTSSITLFHALADISRLHTSWNLSPPIADDDDLSATVSDQRIFAQAKRALTVIAAVSTILEQAGKAQVHSASSLLSRQVEELPKSLVDRLKKIAFT